MICGVENDISGCHLTVFIVDIAFVLTLWLLTTPIGVLVVLPMSGKISKMAGNGNLVSYSFDSFCVDRL